METKIKDFIEEVSSQPITKYFNYPIKVGRKIIQLPNEKWFFLFTNNEEYAVFILKTKFQIIACQICHYKVNIDYDIVHFRNEVILFFQSKLSEENIIVKELPKNSHNNHTLTVVKQIFYKYS
ncbi:MAG TPA: hypothetical protein VFW78_06190 [Bacteroidia bacterium]|nr:hypothetical protein [Bacteroidia bacterium]